MPKECLFCPHNLAEDDHDRLWRAFYDEGEAAALRAARELGLACERDDLHRHFDAHRPRQAPPARRRSGEKAPRLRARKQAIVDLARRFRGFTSPLIAYSLYWPAQGLERQIKAAEANALRDLRDLFARDLLYRLYPEHVPGPPVRRDLPPSFFLGGRGPAFLEAKGHLFEGARLDVLRDARQAPVRESILRWQRTSELLAAFFRKLPASSGLGRRHRIAPTGAVVELDLANIYDERWAQLRFTDPLKLASGVRAQAVCAFRVRTPGGLQALVPAFIYHDRGISPVERLTGEIPAQAALARSGELRRAFPSLERSGAPVTLFFVDRAEQLQKLMKAAQRPAQAPIPAFAALTGAFRSADPADFRFLSVGSSKRRQLTLFELLCEQAGAFADGVRLRSAR